MASMVTTNNRNSKTRSSLKLETLEALKSMHLMPTVVRINKHTTPDDGPLYTLLPPSCGGASEAFASAARTGDALDFLKELSRDLGRRVQG